MATGQQSPFGGPSATRPTNPIRSGTIPRKFMRVTRLDGDFGEQKMLVHIFHILFVLPNGPRLGGKAAGCRIQLADGTMWSLSDSFDEIVMALEEN